MYVSASWFSPLVVSSSDLGFMSSAKTLCSSGVSSLVSNRYVQNLWASVKGMKTVSSSRGGTSFPATTAFVRRSMMVEISFFDALTKGKAYDPLLMSKESLNNGSVAAVKMVGYSQ